MFDIQHRHLALNIPRKFGSVQYLIWHFMLIAASKKIYSQRMHKISMARLTNFLNLKNINEINKKILKMTEPVEKAPLSYHFETIEITNNTISYIYPIELISILSSQFIKEISQKLTDVRFSSKYSFYLYEYCLYYQIFECIHFSPIYSIRTFMQLPDKQYPNFKSFHNKIIIPALYELNEKTSLKISVQYKKFAKSVAALRFAIENKKSFNGKPNIINETPEGRTKKFGFFLKNVALTRYHRLAPETRKTFDLEFEAWAMERHPKIDLKDPLTKEKLKTVFLHKECLASYEKKIYFWTNRTQKAFQTLPNR